MYTTLPHCPGPEYLRTSCNSFESVLRRLERLALDDSITIVLCGESGTGKTTIARWVHERSPRRAAPFQHVVLSALNDNVAGSDLAGHVAGAYTDARRNRNGHFISANSGTLFLDEIGKASLAVQNMLLHAIEYKEVTPIGADRAVKVDVRIVTATNVSLAELVAGGKFLPDLYGRLRSFQVAIPPLRERRADIPCLMALAIERHARNAGYSVPPTVDDALAKAIKAAPWVDNLRGLDGFIHRILIEADGAPKLTLGHCTGALRELVQPVRDKRTVTYEEAAEALRVARTFSGAARIVGIDRKTLRSIVNRADASGSEAVQGSNHANDPSPRRGPPGVVGGA